MKDKIIDFVKTFQPVSDRVIVLPEEQQKETDTGLLNSGTKQGEDKRVIGTVLCAGKGRYSETGELVPMQFKGGETVIFSKYVGDDLLINEDLVIKKYDGSKRDEEVLITIVRADSLLSILP